MRTGLPSTSEPKVEVFLRAAFHPQNGELRVTRAGRIWEAISTAHSAGSRGSGKVIAVIDIGFDATMLPADRIHPASTISPWIAHPDRGRHGTAVALIALAAAPEAKLLLIDVREGERFGVIKTAAAITAAAERGATVTNISAEFETDCEPRDPGDLNVDAILGIDPDPGPFIGEVDRWVEFSEPYADARCRRKCRICDAVVATSDSTMVIAAAGNRYPASCPACTGSSVGVGFQRSVIVEIGGDVLRATLLPVTEHGNPTNPELMIDEPPGFDGTSFASPLVAGLAALLPEPRDAGLMAGLSRAATPLLMLATCYRDNIDSAPPRTVTTLLSGFERFAMRIPAPHRHWRAEGAQPCALCALVLMDWYDTLVSVHLLRGAADEALTWGTTAAAIAPYSATSASNAGLAWELHAAFSSGMERDDALRSARRELERAVRMAPDIVVYRALLARIRASGTQKNSGVPAMPSTIRLPHLRVHR